MAASKKADPAAPARTPRAKTRAAPAPAGPENSEAMAEAADTGTGDMPADGPAASPFDHAFAALEQAEAMLRHAATFDEKPLGAAAANGGHGISPLNDMITAAIASATDSATHASAGVAAAMREYVTAHAQALGMYNAVAQQQADAITAAAATSAAVARLLAGSRLSLHEAARGTGIDAIERLRGAIDAMRAPVNAQMAASPPAASPAGAAADG